MNNFKNNFFGTLIIACFALLGITFLSCNTCNDDNLSNSQEELKDHYRGLVHSTFHDKARRHNADTKYLIIVDYSIPSNKDRLFIWDTEKDEIVEKFWCAHGFGGNSTAEKPEFSNKLGSNCSSLGWFLVDKSVGVSESYGYRYHAVDGLDASNSNARRRGILIHTWISVTRDYEARINRPMDCDYRSAGCFTTTEDGYLALDRYIKNQPKRLLLLAINGIE